MSPAIRFLCWAASILSTLALLAGLLYAAAALASVPLALCLCLADFGLLSAIAYLLFTTPPDAIKLRPWFSILIIMSVTVAVRVLGLRSWNLTLSRAPAPHLFNAAMFTSSTLAAVDAVIVFALITVLLLRRTSPWWAILYAWHPLPLVQIASGEFGSMQTYPGFFATLCGGLPHPARCLQFFALFALLMIAALAFRCRWTIVRTVIHLLLVGLLFSPGVLPWIGVIPLALCTLRWNRAAWLLSYTLLLNYTAIDGAVPLWAIAVQWTPVMVLEVQQLFIDCRTPSNPVQPSPDPALPLTTTVATHGT